MSRHPEKSHPGLDRLWFSPAQTWQRLDARYDAAMDVLDSTEYERLEAAPAIVRERVYSG